MTVAIAALASVGCVCAPPVCPTPDGCGGPVDAGRDAGVDAGRDAGGDGGVDAERDAGPPGDAGWFAVSGFDEDCDLTIALDPEAAVPSLTSRPCEGVVGCRELVFPSLPEGSFVRVNDVASGPRWDDVSGTGLFSWFVVESGASGVGEYTLVDELGRTRQVWHIDASGTCLLGTHTGGGGRSAVAVRRSEPVGGAMIGTALIDDPTSARMLANIPYEEMPLQAVQYMPISASAIALNTTGGAQLWHVSNDGVATRLVWGGGVDHYVDDVHEDAIFGTDLTAMRHVRVSVAGGPYEPFIVPSGADAFDIRTDGVHLVWKQGYGRISVSRYERVELWTSPYTTNPAELEPRRVADAPLPLAHNQIDTYGGVVIDATEGGTRYLATFLDGSPTREVLAPDGHVMNILFAGPEEVAMLVYRIVPRVVAVRFYRYDALPLAE